MIVVLSAALIGVAVVGAQPVQRTVLAVLLAANDRVGTRVVRRDAAAGRRKRLNGGPHDGRASHLQMWAQLAAHQKRKSAISALTRPARIGRSAAARAAPIRTVDRRGSVGSKLHSLHVTSPAISRLVISKRRVTRTGTRAASAVRRAANSHGQRRLARRVINPTSPVGQA